MVKTKNLQVSSGKQDQSSGAQIASVAYGLAKPLIRGIGGIKTDPKTENLYLDFQKYASQIEAQYTRKNLEKSVPEYFKEVKNKIDAQKGQATNRFINELNSNIGLYYPDTSSEVRNKLNDIIIKKTNGHIGEQEFNLLWEKIVTQIEKDHKKRKNFEESLRAQLKGKEGEILQKIENNTLEKDDINKYQVLMFIVLISPFVPIPLFHPVAGFVDSFLTSGGIGNFLPSLFSTSGPLGSLATFTDAIGLDDLMKIICEALGGPLSIVDSVVLNPITTPIATAGVGGINAGSLIPAGLVALFVNQIGEKGGKSLLERTLDLSDAQSKAKTAVIDEKENIAKYFKQQEIAESEVAKERGKENSKEIINEERKIGIVKDISEWLKTKYNIRPKAIEVLIKNLFKEKEGDKKAGFAEEIIEILKNKEIDRVDNLLSKFYPKIDEDGFKNLLKLKASNRDDEVFNLPYFKEIERIEGNASKIFNWSKSLGSNITGGNDANTEDDHSVVLSREMDQKLNEIIKDVDYEKSKKAMEDEWDMQNVKTAPSASPKPPITKKPLKSQKNISNYA